MHGRSESQLTQCNHIYVNIKQLVETFLAFSCLASVRLLHIHSTVGETPPDNVMIISGRYILKGQQPIRTKL